MPTFKCKIATSSGGIVEKNLIADNKASLKEHLENEGNFLLQIRKTGRGESFFQKGINRKRFKIRDFLSFNHEFSVLIKAGLPIVKALDSILEKDDEGELNDILKEIRNDVFKGGSLSDSFRKYSNLVSNFYVASLAAGEKSGNIPVAISRYLKYMKKMLALRQKVVSASIYPAILIVVSTFVLFFLLIYVVPTFTQTYFSAGTKLPRITLFLVVTGGILKSNFVEILFCLIFLAAGFFYFRRSETGRLYIDKWKLAVPFLGDIYSHFFVSKMSRTLSMVLASGTPLVNSVQISADTMGNKFLKLKIEMVIKLLKEGAGFSKSLLKTEVFPKLAIRMIDAGESAGALEKVLDDVSDFYENSVDTKLSILSSSIEPILMVIMGFMIGFIVLAMYLPIFQLAGTVT